jgi:hypothetical protein
MIGDDFQGLGQHDQRGSLTLPMNLEGLDGLYDAQLGSFIIFHHRITPVQSVLVLKHFDYSCNFGSIIEHNLINLTKGIILIKLPERIP